MVIKIVQASFLTCLGLFLGLGVLTAIGEDARAFVGQWRFRNEEMEVTAEFTSAGTFQQTTKAKLGEQTYFGRYQVSGSLLQLWPQGALMPLQFSYRFSSRDAFEATDAAGNRFALKRLPTQPTTPATNAPLPAAPNSSQTTNDATAAAKTRSAQPRSARRQPTLVLERTWEPNEKAFWFLKPKGWLLSGGIFNVNPMQMNGPGNTVAPKNDLSVKMDAAGTVMFRWAPVWYYADLTYFGLAANGFPTGSYYRGMLVKPIPTPKAYLLELLRTARPTLSDLKVVAEDPMPEIVEAYIKANQPINQALTQMGKRPNGYAAAAIVVEYTENGCLFREALTTVIVDTRASTFAWNNERTVMLRAPATEFERWKSVLDSIRTSDHMNPDWVTAVNRNVATRTQNVRETDNYLNRVAHEIVENRRKTNAEIRHENWLFITGQDEYKNPFTGEIERDSSEYRHRWVNNQGDVILTDQNDFDPNAIEEYKTREWKPSPVWDRQNK